MRRPLHLLIVEDCPADAELLLRELRRNGYDISFERVQTRSEMAAALDRDRWDVVIADYSMPHFDVFQAMRLLKERHLDLPFIIVSGAINDEIAAASMRAGARDYLVKHNLARLVPALDRELQQADERREWQRMNREMSSAQKIQQSLLPSQDASVPGFDVAGAAFPANHTTGDYFDFIPMPDGYLGVVIGDVMGHGVGPAILMAEIRAFLRSLAMTHADVGEILTHTNLMFLDGAPEGTFVTLLLARVDPVSQTLTHASAGHRGYLIDGSGNLRCFLDSSGLPLGVRENNHVASLSRMQLHPNDIVLLVTDGVGEAHTPDGDVFGIERILTTVGRHHREPARQIVRSLYREVRQFLHGAPQQDDMTVVVLKSTPDQLAPAPC